MGVWNKVYPYDDNPTQITLFFDDIGESLKKETKGKLSYKMVFDNNIDKQLTYFYDFDIIYTYRDIETKYRLYSVSYSPFNEEGKLTLKTYLFNETLSKGCEVFTELSDYIEELCNSEKMGNVIGRIIHMANE